MTEGALKTVRELREARQWKQIDLAFRTGTTVNTIARIEGGNQEPHVRLAQEIARALGVATDDITWPEANARPAARQRRRAAGKDASEDKR